MKISEYKLSKIQERAFRKLVKSGEWKCAYSLQESISTLDSLFNKGLVARKILYTWSPRVNIEYKAKYKFMK
jgi:hypothetical protein